VPALPARGAAAQAPERGAILPSPPEREARFPGRPAAPDARAQHHRATLPPSRQTRGCAPYAFVIRALSGMLAG
jgi:hypothetical protein